MVVSDLKRKEGSGGARSAKAQMADLPRPHKTPNVQS